MVLRNVPSTATLEEQRVEINELAVDVEALAAAVAVESLQTVTDRGFTTTNPIKIENNAATAFVIEDGSSNEKFVVDSVNGKLNVGSSAGGASGIYLFHNNSGATPAITLDGATGGITADGTGTFGGDISVQDSSYLRVRATGDNASTAVQLGPDGTGSFASGALSISNVGVTTVDIAGGNSGWAFYASNNDSRTGRPTFKATNKAGGELFGGTNADASANVFAIQSNGSAEFAGDLTLGSYNAGSNGVRGLFYTETDGLTVQAPAGTTQGLFKGLGGSSSDVKVNILADGSAEFAGNTTVGAPDVTNASTGGVQVFASGQLRIQRNGSGSASDKRFQIYYGTTETASITADGTATFGGTITSTISDNQFTHAIGSSAAKGGLYNHANGGYLFLRDSSSNGTVTLNGDSGSGTFTGEIKIEGSSTPAGLSSRISKYGSLLIGTTSDAVGDARLSIDSGNGNITSIGSATFAGDGHFQCNGTDPEHGVKFINDGEIKIWRPTGGGSTVNLIKGSAGVGSEVEQFAIKADGSASFAGILEASLLVNTNKTPTAGEGIEVFYDSAASGGAAGSIQAYDRDGAALTRLKIKSSNWEILNDGSATFGAFNTSSLTTHGVTIDQYANSHSGVRVQSTDVATTVGEFFAGYRGSNPVFQVTTGGSATFAGTVKSGALDLSNTSAAGIEVRSTGEILLQRPSNQGTSSLIDGRLGNTQNVNILANGSATFAGTISDSKGDLRKIPHKQESSAYTLVAADAGKAIEIQGNLTVPNSVFAAGDTITIINDTSSDKTISKGTGLTYMFNTADGTNANRTLGGRGMATIYFVNSTTCYISGSQLS